jgi:hypothetical protein
VPEPSPEHPPICQLTDDIDQQILICKETPHMNYLVPRLEALRDGRITVEDYRRRTTREVAEALGIRPSDV